MHSSEQVGGRASTRLLALALAVVYVALDAAKPLQMDDPYYYLYARQIAERPLDPYGFTLMYWNWLFPANWVLAPPVLPYWWALAIRLFGEQPVLWKLWLLPFALAFTLSLESLFHRFARGL